MMPQTLKWLEHETWHLRDRGEHMDVCVDGSAFEYAVATYGQDAPRFHGTMVWFDDQMARMQLLAAAPQLYRATRNLSALLVWLADKQLVGPDSFGDDLRAKWLAEAKAALAIVHGDVDILRKDNEDNG